MKIYVIGLFFLLVMSGCVCLEIIYAILLSTSTHSEKKVTITKEYVINPNWDEDNNFFKVTRMLLKDSSKIINLNNPSEPELYYGLVEDTSFAYVTGVKYNGTPYSKRKVYFNRYNGFTWAKLYPLHSNYEQEIIGELQKNTWYLLEGLSIYHTTLYYVYVDSLDSVHVFKVWSMTNY